MEKVIIGNATLYCGDCREILPGLGKFDLILTDPPYGIGFVHSGKDSSGIGGGKYRTKFVNEKIIGDDKSFDPLFILGIECKKILWGGNHFASRLPDSQSWLVWDKRAASGHSNDFADCEIAWTNLGMPARMFRHHWDGMMRASEKGVPRVHPTQKPIALMEWCIRAAKDVSVVFDPFMGSGSTGVAAMNLGLKFIGVEIHRPYFDIACRRIEEAQRQAPLIPHDTPPVAVQGGFDLGL